MDNGAKAVSALERQPVLGDIYTRLISLLDRQRELKHMVGRTLENIKVPNPMPAVPRMGEEKESKDFFSQTMNLITNLENNTDEMWAVSRELQTFVLGDQITRNEAN